MTGAQFWSALIFQFTPPRGGDLVCERIHLDYNNFNSRPRVGATDNDSPVTFKADDFNSRPRVGATH